MAEYEQIWRKQRTKIDFFNRKENKVCRHANKNKKFPEKIKKKLENLK